MTMTSDSRVIVVGYTDARHLNFIGTGVSIAENLITDSFDLTFTAGIGASSSDTLSNKNIILTNNTVTDTSTSAGDLAKSNGTKFLRFPRGSAGQFLATNSGGSDLTWLTPYTRGEATGTGNASSVTFTITHGLGVNPGAVSVEPMTVASAATYYVTHSSSTISITYSSAPASAAALGWSWVAFQ